MPSDIMTKVNAGSGIFNGSIITSCNKLGMIQVIHPDAGHNHAPVPSGVENRLTNRFDDPTYYTA